MPGTPNNDMASINGAHAEPANLCKMAPQTSTVSVGPDDVDALRRDLAAHGQSHLLAFWDELTLEERTRLFNDIRSIDIARVNSFFREGMQTMASASKLDEKLRPLPKECFSTLIGNKKDHARWETEGYKQIAAGKVCALLLAGGQGTRLGTTNPKGMYDVGLPSGKSLYQIQGERIAKLQKLVAEKMGVSNVVIPWYIMTSEATKEMTIDYFAARNYFGLHPANLIFFEQGTLPCMTTDGKIILESKSSIARSPDGNGGLYNALASSGALADMRARGIEHVHAYCVDNILVHVADPVFIGYCVEKGAVCGNKVVPKAHPSEPVGVLCLCDGKYQVVEYSEITPQTAQRRNEDGALTFNAANIANHYFHVSFLEDIARKHIAEMHHHMASKKIPTIDARGNPVQPSSNNGFKMELFIFDVFPFAASMAVLETDRQSEFSPLKNAPSAADSNPVTCRRDLMALHKRFIVAAGGTIEGDEAAAECEIDPAVSYAGEGLESIVKGRSFRSPILLKSA